MRGHVTAVVLGALLLAAFVWSPAFFEPSATGFGDWQMIWHNWEAGRVSLLRHGEWPLWDPYHCGGITIFGNPESQHFSPLFPLALLIGTTLALKVFLVLHAAAGFSGMYLLATRHYAMRPCAALLASVAWGASGFFAWHGSGGHGTFLPFFLAPWVLLAFRHATDRPEHTPLLAALMALVIAEGGTYPLPYLTLLVVFDAFALSREPKKRRAALGVLLLGGGLAALVAAIRLLPIRATLAQMPRTVESTDAITLADVLAMLTDTDHAYRWGHEFVWAEYGTYVGWGVVALAILGLATAWRPGRRHLIAGLVLFGALMMGSAGPFHPWPLLHELPIYDSLRVPSRFAVLFTLYLALLAGMTVERLALWLDGFRLRPGLDRVRPAGAYVVALLLCADVIAGNWSVVDRFDWAPLDDSSPAERFHLVPARNYIRQYASLPGQNQGTPTCYVGGMNWQVAPGLWLDDVPQARIIGGEGGDVASEGRTGSTVWAEVRLPAPARVVFNQNFFPGWESDLGTVVSEAGMLAVDAPAGDQRIVARYEPPSLPLAAALSLLGLLLSVFVLRFGTAGRWRELWARLGRTLGVRRP